MEITPPSFSLLLLYRLLSFSSKDLLDKLLLIRNEPPFNQQFIKTAYNDKLGSIDFYFANLDDHGNFNDTWNNPSKT